MEDCTRAPADRPTTVLYVEDEPTNVLLMQAIFEREPAYRLEVAGDGASARRAVRESPPDLLLLDIRLPDCRGDELLQSLRAFDGMADVPAVALTAEYDFCVDGTTFSAVWRKPVNVRELFAQLEQLLRHQRQPETSH